MTIEAKGNSGNSVRRSGAQQWRVLALVLMQGVALPGLALAETAGPSALTNASAQGNAVSDVVVTAERRSTSLQKTAVAVTAVTAANIQDHDLVSARSLQGAVPDLYVPSAANSYTNDYYSIRGFTEIDTFFESPVGIYVDGVYIQRVLGSNMRSPDLERIEVLRGPQGTLFGRHTEAGAISYVT